MNAVFQIIEAVGSLATFGAFIFLFRRDKDKQAQIDRLAGIATILEAQNETMKKQNELIAQQVEIFRNTAILGNNDRGAIDQLRDIEEKKLKLSVLPILWTNGAGYNGSSGEFNIDLSNKGETAIIHDLKNNSEDVRVYTNLDGYEIEKGKSIRILGIQSGNKHVKDCDIDIDVLFQDRLKNNYRAKIKGVGNHVKVVETIEL